MKCTHPHWCPNWDYLLIDSSMIEFEACLCECKGCDFDEVL